MFVAVVAVVLPIYAHCSHGGKCLVLFFCLSVFYVNADASAAVQQQKVKSSVANTVV